MEVVNMKKVFVIIAMILVSVLAKAECVEQSHDDVPVRESIGTVR